MGALYVQQRFKILHALAFRFEAPWFTGVSDRLRRSLGLLKGGVKGDAVIKLRRTLEILEVQSVRCLPTAFCVGLGEGSERTASQR